MAGNKVTHGKVLLGVYHSTHNGIEMMDEKKRLETYTTWSESWPVKPQDLAKAGFYYLGFYDRVKCFSCTGEIEGWEAEDKPKGEHFRHYPKCHFIIKIMASNDVIDGQGKQSDINIDGTDSRPVLENIPMMTVVQQLVRVLILDMIPAGFEKMCKRPDYAQEKSRLQTFENWPPKFKESAPKAKWLANAGFYYTGSTDLARCFCCSGGIDCWEPHDEPWYEHAKSYPTCKWLIHIKGQCFIDAVQRAERGTDGEDNSTETPLASSAALHPDRNGEKETVRNEENLDTDDEKPGIVGSTPKLSNAASAESDEGINELISPSPADQKSPSQKPLKRKTDGKGSIVSVDDIMSSETAQKEATSSESVRSDELTAQNLADLAIDGEPKTQ